MICTTFAPCGNPFTFAATQPVKVRELPGNMRPALSKSNVRQIRSARANGVSYKTLMAMYSMSRETLARAATGRGTYEGF